MITEAGIDGVLANKGSDISSILKKVEILRKLCFRGHETTFRTASKIRRIFGS